MVEILSNDRKRLTRTLYMMLTLDGFLILLTSLTGYFYATEDNTFLSYHPFPKQCLPCTHLAHHPDDPLVGIVKNNDDIGCCASQKQNILQVVDKFVEKWLKNYLAKESPQYRGCKHVESNPQKNNPKKDFFKIHGFDSQRLNVTHHRRVHWDENTALHSERMEYKHGYVTIPQTGLYQIYSQVVADFEEEPDQYSGNLNLFMHQIAVKKHNGNYGERCIIASTQSQCETKEDGCIKSHIGTVYRFHKGDKLVVKATYPERIRPNPKMNFFGIHMI